MEEVQQHKMSKTNEKRAPLCTECGKHLDHRNRWSDLRRANKDFVCLECRPPKQWTEQQIEAFSEKGHPQYIYVDKDMKPCVQNIHSRRAKYVNEYDLYSVEV